MAEPLAPQEIARRTFSVARRGYEQQEVRGFLHEVSALLERSSRTESELRERAERAEAKLTPTPKPTPTPQPDRQAKPQPAVASVYRGRTVSDSAWKQEFERRMDWVEATTGRPADPEDVLRGLRRELEGPTLDELYAETIGRRSVAA